MGGEDALSGQADLQLLMAGVLSQHPMRCLVQVVGRGPRVLSLLCPRLVPGWGSVGDTQVGAEYVNDRPTVPGVVLGYVLKGIQGAEPDRGLLVAKLFDSLGIAVGQLALLSQVELVLSGF